MSRPPVEPQSLGAFEATIACDGCDDSTPHAIHAMDDGAIVIVCSACGTVSVLQERGDRDGAVAASRSFAACTRPACAPDRRDDPQGWCRHDHRAWSLASAPSYEEWLGAALASEIGAALVGEDRP